ncbi:MAG: hypothetical protein NDF57_02890 [archaeon GBS-70-058]|nr:hypothetical protein [Candidatus Culexarchaeum nevadense]
MLSDKQMKIKNEEECIVEILTANQERFRIKLLRAIAPLTVSQIMRKLPLKSIIIIHEGKMYIPLDIDVKADKTVKRAVRGDVTYSTISKSMVIYMRDSEIQKPEIKLGQALDIEELSKIKSGTSIILTGGDK